MRGKICFIVSVFVLAASVWFAWYRVKADEAARALYQEAEEAAGLIKENDFSSIEEYRDFIGRVNDAISKKKKGASEKLAKEAGKLKKEISKRAEGLEKAKETETSCRELLEQLSGIEEVAQEASELQAGLDILQAAVSEKNGEKAENQAKEVEKIADELGGRLQEKTEDIQRRLDEEEEDSIQYGAELFSAWKQESREAYGNQDYSRAYATGKKALRVKEYSDNQRIMAACLSGGTFGEGKGRLVLTLPAGTPDMEGKKENLYLMESADDGIFEKRTVTELRKAAPSENVTVVSMRWDGSGFGNGESVMSSVTVPWEMALQTEPANGSIWNGLGGEYLEIDGVYGSGAFDALYKAVEKAAEIEGDAVVFASLEGNFGSPRHTFEEVIQLARVNQVMLFVASDSYRMVGNEEYRIVQSGGNTVYSACRFDFQTVSLAEIYALLSQQSYEIEYETPLAPTASREVEFLLMEAQIFGDTYQYLSDRKIEKKPREEAQISAPGITPDAGLPNREEQPSAEGGNLSSSADYIFPDSSQRYLTENDLAGLTPEELRIARNEIYARHGRKFTSPELQQYFDGKPWYIPSIEAGDFKDEMLNEVERYNTRLISGYEKQ